MELKVQSIIEKKLSNLETNHEEDQIDLMVYKLYHLTYEEACLVDPDIPFSKDAYEKADLVANIY